MWIRSTWEYFFRCSISPYVRSVRLSLSYIRYGSKVAKLTTWVQFQMQWGNYTITLCFSNLTSSLEIGTEVCSQLPVSLRRSSRSFSCFRRSFWLSAIAWSINERTFLIYIGKEYNVNMTTLKLYSNSFVKFRVQIIEAVLDYLKYSQRLEIFFR